MRNGAFFLFLVACAAFFGGCGDSARWPSFTVEYHANDGTGRVASVVYRHGIDRPLTHVFTRDGFAFDGWARLPNGGGRVDGDTILTEEDEGVVRLYALWVTVGVTQFTVTFHANGGTGNPPSPMQVAQGSSITLPGPGGLTRGGFAFGGWGTSATGIGTPLNVGDWFTPTGSVTLFAIWVPDQPQDTLFTVTFDANDGSGSPPSPQQINQSSGITLPGPGGLTRSGHTFGGWSTNVAGIGTPLNVGDWFTPTGDITLFAIWIPAVSVPEATLAAQFAWFRSNAASNTSYVIDISDNPSIAHQALTLPAGVNNVSLTIRSTGAMRTVNSATGVRLFTVGSGVTLVLDNNITLMGSSSNLDHLVQINAGGTLVMNAGSRITGNTASNTGGGVGIGSGGTFTMYGGEISNNATIGGSAIQGGGGVFVASGGTFNMRGGTILGNSSAQSGGGVNNQGTFRISGGIIHGGTAAMTLRNTAVNGAALFTNGTAQRGTFNAADAFTSLGALTTTDATIDVLNGVLR